MYVRMCGCVYVCYVMGHVARGCVKCAEGSDSRRWVMPREGTLPLQAMEVLARLLLLADEDGSGGAAARAELASMVRSMRSQRLILQVTPLWLLYGCFMAALWLCFMATLCLLYSCCMAALCQFYGCCMANVRLLLWLLYGRPWVVGTAARSQPSGRQHRDTETQNREAGRQPGVIAT